MALRTQKRHDVAEELAEETQPCAGLLSEAERARLAIGACCTSLRVRSIGIGGQTVRDEVGVFVVSNWFWRRASSLTENSGSIISETLTKLHETVSRY